jgi:glycosyltransferase involved in cell wall biosynthesis
MAAPAPHGPAAAGVPHARVAPRVSVVIPTYNRADYIAAAIDSVLGQTLPGAEIIVVDDGSTDDTADRLAAYGDRLVCLRTPNRGFAMARNAGMEAARGDYIAWLDSDDEYWPFKLELQVRLLDARPDVGFVYSDLSGFDDAGYYDERHLRTYHASAYRGVAYEDLFAESATLAQNGLGAALVAAGRADWLDHRVYVGDVFEQYLLRTVVFTNSILFRRELFAVAGPQQRRFGLFTDLEFVLRLSRLARAAFIDVPTYKLRYHPGQISTSATPGGKLVTIRKQRDLLRVLEAFIRENPAYYVEHRAVLDRQRARLHRAIAIPMLAFTPRTPHERRVYPRRARRHLARAAALGAPDRTAWALSYVPKFVQQAAQTVVRALRRTRQGSATSAAPHAP